MQLDFSVNWLAVIVAAVASMALGFVWYMTLAKPWMAAVGKTREELQSGDPSPYIWSTLCQLVMAYFLAVLTSSMFDAVTVVNAVQAGFLLWLGFVITSMITNHRYQGDSWTLTAIDGGYMLGILLVQGVVIGLFG